MKILGSLIKEASKFKFDDKGELWTNNGEKRKMRPIGKKDTDTTGEFVTTKDVYRHLSKSYEGKDRYSVDWDNFSGTIGTIYTAEDGSKVTIYHTPDFNKDLNGVIPITIDIDDDFLVSYDLDLREFDKAGQLKSLENHIYRVVDLHINTTGISEIGIRRLPNIVM